MTDDERAKCVEVFPWRSSTAGGLALSEVRSIWSEVRQTATELAEAEEAYRKIAEAEDSGRLHMSA